MPTITFEHDNYTGTIRAHRVYAKTLWSDEWELKEHLVCTMAKWTCAPQIGQASLYYRYGHAIVPGNPEAGYLQPFTLPTLAYVKIEFDALDLTDPPSEGATTTIPWFGLVGSLVEQYGGTTAHDGSTVPQGVQQLNAVGLEWLLDRQYITDCMFTNQSEAAAPTRTNIASGFNLPLRESETLTTFGTLVESVASKNRSVNPKIDSGRTFYCFIDHAEDNENWSTKTIVEYLLATQAPRTVGDIQPITWELYDPDNVLPTWDKPQIDQHGFRLWQVLNQTISRQRCMGFWLDVDEASSPAKILIVPFTFTATDIFVPGTSNKIPANGSEITWELVDDLTANVQASTDAFAKFDQVRVIGARAIHVATLKVGQGLKKGWSSSDETAYEAGAVGESGYPASTELSERHRHDMKYRHQERFAKVYRRFELDPDWNLKSEGDEHPVFPEHPDTAPEVWEPREYLLDSVYFVPIPFSENQTQYFDKPHVCKYFASNETDSIFEDGEMIKAMRVIDGESGANFAWSATIHPLQEPGKLDLHVNGDQRHIIDSANYTKLDWEPDLGQDYDLANSLFTLGLTADYFCESRYPADDALSATNDLHRIRIIEAGDKYRLVFLVRDTTLYIESNGTQRQASSSSYVIDDREKLLQIATQAFGWYGRDRVSINVVTGLISDGIWLGEMITEINSRSSGSGVEVNTVITSITLTQQLGNGFTVPPPRIAYQTEHAEFDFLSFATTQK